MSTLDRTALLAHLRKRADAQASLVAAAVLDGLATAIERGDFDEPEPVKVMPKFGQNWAY